MPKKIMTYEETLQAIGHQRMRRINGLCFTVDKYEYQINCYGGFSCYVSVDYRKIGSSKFKFLDAYFGYYKTVGDALKGIKELIDEKKGA